MKNFVLLLLVVAALLYAHRSCTPLGQRLAAEKPEAAQSHAGGPVREWQQAPNTVMDMQGAIGGAGPGPANAARDLVRDQVGQ